MLILARMVATPHHSILTCSNILVGTTYNGVISILKAKEKLTTKFVLAFRLISAI